MLRSGDLVTWAPPDEAVAGAVPLEPGHPGRVVEPVCDSCVGVDWADRPGVLALDGCFDQAWLTPITAEEFAERSAAVRRRRREREEAGRAAGRTYLARPD